MDKKQTEMTEHFHSLWREAVDGNIALQEREARLLAVARAAASLLHRTSDWQLREEYDNEGLLMPTRKELRLLAEALAAVEDLL